MYGETAERELERQPIISDSRPHANRLAYTDLDRIALEEYLRDPRSTNSFFGREGLLAVYEDELCSFFGRRHCILFNSGTSALHTAYFALDVRPGDEVIVPTYTHHATVMPLCTMGCAIRFADCSIDTGNIDPAHVEALIGPRTKGIVVTHQWGHPGELPRLRTLADKHHIFLVEDVSLAVCSNIDHQLAGSFGDVTCFSLGSSKMFSGGQGGAMLLDNTTLYERATLFGHFGQRSYEEVQSLRHRRYADTGWGMNYRMHALAVAVSRARFKRRDELIAARHKRFNRLTAGLEKHPFLRPPSTREGCFRGQWQGYCVRVDESCGATIDAVHAVLSAEGVQVMLGGYQQPLHTRAFFRDRESAINTPFTTNSKWRRYKHGDLPNAEMFYSKSLGFPLFLDEPLSLIDQYIEACWKIA